MSVCFQTAQAFVAVSRARAIGLRLPIKARRRPRFLLIAIISFFSWNIHQNVGLDKPCFSLPESFKCLHQNRDIRSMSGAVSSFRSKSWNRL